MSGRVVNLGKTMGLFRSTEIGSLGQVGADGLGERVIRELRAENVTAQVTLDRGALEVRVRGY